jgi:lipopolysaccharide/colanic/teichoic acid biosynthesis glycosyltransferase
MINALKNKFYEMNSNPETNHMFIYDEKDFKSILKYERKRTDREGKCFSLIVINCNKNIKKLIEEINKKIRKIDHLGWLSENCLALLLPLTDYSMATEMNNILFDKSLNGLSKNTVKIYTYPDHWYSESENDGNLLNDYNINFINQSGTKEKITDAFVSKIPLWKRFFDIIVSLLLIIFISPLLILTYFYIKILSPGPVIFKQKRIGYKRKSFDFFKFRTMHINNDQKVHESYLSQLINNDKPMEKLDLKNDKRIIKGGRILRKLCIDELPQLFNVLKGDMSLVGPRPCLPYEEKEYIHWFRNRFDILPGMTGLWQVSGKNKLSFKQMIRLDIKYISHLSLKEDIRIILLTIPTVINLAFEKKSTKMKNILNINHN